MKSMDVTKLLDKAVQAAGMAYSPYSKYSVGAALLAENDKIYTGCNVENASYGLTICAERLAVDSAVTDGQQRFVAMAIVASGGTLPQPCGACRQVLSEFCGPDFPVYVADGNDLANHHCHRLGDLLPHSFSL